MQANSFYHQHLENVSRSFSFCIMQLVSPAKEWVALSYLLCRIVDTIEDSVWPDNQLQHTAFQQFKLFLNSPPSNEELIRWCNCFPEEIPVVEKQLIADLPLLLIDKEELPPKIQEQLILTISHMIDGMLYFLNHHKKNSVLTLPSLVTSNQYCFFVAGVVGELLTCIYTYLIPEFKWTDALLIQSFHFGLFLQKINILKDQVSDESAGRCYISSRDSLRETLLIHAVESLNYIQSIPIVSGRTYRLFCSWSLFIGLASLKWIDKSWQMNDSYKISTQETSYILSQVKQIIDDNYALAALFNRYLPQHSDLDVAHYPIEENQHLPAWFNAIYPYAFSPTDLVALGF